MLDISVIVLTKDERLHIGRCLERVRPIAKEVFIVDSMSTDGTQEIARNAGAVVVEHTWPGNQAEQFNWALDNLPIKTDWILRLDADEYLTPELIEEIKERLPQLPEDVSGIVLPLGRAFMGRRLHHGIVNGIKMIRLFRRGKCRYESRIMDEHLQVLDGVTVTFNHEFIDDNRLSLSEFIKKHINYADREACMEIVAGFCTEQSEQRVGYAAAVRAKRRQKGMYSRMPLFWRAFGYFCYRYFLKMGFLDGKEGFLWDFLQGFWYRVVVDAKILEIRRACGNDPERIRQWLNEKNA